MPRTYLVGLALLAAAGPLAARDPLPIQGDFPINGTVTGNQRAPRVAIDSDGDFVVTWTSDGQDGDARGIYARQYNANGTPNGAEFRVNQTTAGDQHAPDLSGTDNGHFAIVWLGPDSSGLGVFARIYESNGTAASAEVPVNVTTAGDQLAPAVALDDDGGFLVTWQGPGTNGTEIFGRLFDENGAPLTGEFQINTTGAGDQVDPVAGASDENSQYVVAWTGSDGDGTGIFAQRISVAGALLGAEIPVNTTTVGNQTRPALALSGIELDLADENLFVIAWQGFDADGAGIFVQRFDDDDGSPVEDEERVNQSEVGNQENPAITVDDGLDDELFFVVSWQETDTGALASSRGAPILIRGRRIRGRNPTPPPASAALALNATGTLVAEPAISARPDGWFVAVWESAGGDGDGDGVFARRFLVPRFADGFESGTTAAWSAVTPPPTKSVDQP